MQQLLIFVIQLRRLLAIYATIYYKIGITFGEIGSIVIALVAVTALIRRPWLGIDKVYSPLVRRIELATYDINDSRIPFDLSTFKKSYNINTVVVRNKRWKAAKNSQRCIKNWQ